MQTKYLLFTTHLFSRGWVGRLPRCCLQIRSELDLGNRKRQRNGGDDDYKLWPVNVAKTPHARNADLHKVRYRAHLLVVQVQIRETPALNGPKAGQRVTPTDRKLRLAPALLRLQGSHVVAVVRLIARAPVTPQRLSPHQGHVAQVQLLHLPDVPPRQLVHAARQDQRVSRVGRITVTPHVHQSAAHAVLQAQGHQVAAVEVGARLVALPTRLGHRLIVAVIVVALRAHQIVSAAESVVGIRGMVTATHRRLVVVHEGEALAGADGTQVLYAVVHRVDIVTAPALIAGPSLRKVIVDLQARSGVGECIVAKVRLLRGHDEGVESRFHAARVHLREESAAAIGND